MKKSYLLFVPLIVAALSGCESGGGSSKPYVAPAKDINSMADFEKMVSDNPINSSASKTPARYSLNVDLDFKNANVQYQIKDVELIGNKHRLKNFNISVTNYAGLFAKADNCIFSDLTIMNASVRGNYAGALVGKVENAAIFKNIKVTNEVAVGDGVDYQVGGIVGYAENANITNCVNNAKIQGTESVGGIVGYAKNTDITSCINYGDISSLLVGNGIGGVCGTYFNYFRYEAREDTFSGNENYGSVYGEQSDCVGGLIGEHHPFVDFRGSKYPKITIAKSTNYGVIEGKNNVGGISGTGICDLTETDFTSCTNIGSVIGENYVGGIVGYTKDFSIDKAYSQGDEIKQVSFVKCKSQLNENKDNFIKGESYVGGIAGNGTSFVVCKNYVDVITVKSDFPEVSDTYFPEEYQHSIGGIVGFGYSGFDLSEFKATNCENYGKIQGISDEIPYKLASSLGGIVGFSYGGEFNRCINAGELNAAQCVGGIIGTIEPRQSTYLSENTSSGNIIVNRCAGGLIGDIESSEEHCARIQIATNTVNIEEALVYGSTSTPEEEPYKYVIGGLIGRANSTATLDNCYETVALANYESSFSYRSPADATNMTVDKVVGYSKVNEHGKKLVSYSPTYADEHAVITRIGDIE